MPLPILKSERVADSRASTVDGASFLSNPKKEQFWNASRLLAIKRFNPLRLSLKIRSSLWYLVDDDISKSKGLKEVGFSFNKVKKYKSMMKNPSVYDVIVTKAKGNKCFGTGPLMPEHKLLAYVVSLIITPRGNNDA